MNAKDRFEAKVGNHGNGCWEWTAHRNMNGYGTFRLEGRTCLAHRAAWELAYGPIPDGIRVLHHCDNPSCVRPDHLFLGTQDDNIRDREEKGRGGTARGERGGTAKLTEAQVLEIRRRADGGETQASLGTAFGVTQVNISHITRRRSWALAK